MRRLIQQRLSGRWAFDDLKAGFGNRGTVDDPDGAISILLQQLRAQFGSLIPDVNRRVGPQIDRVVNGR